MDIRSFSNIQSSRPEGRVILDTGGDAVRAAHPTGRNKVVAWFASKLTPATTKESQNTEIRKQFADALRKEFGGVIGESFAADIRSGGNKPLTLRDIRTNIETAKSWQQAAKDTLFKQREFFAGIDPEGLKHFESVFDEHAASMDLEAGGQKLKFSDFKTDDLQMNIGKELGAANLNQSEEQVVQQFRTSNDALSYQKEKVSSFIQTKQDAFAAIETSDGPTRAALEKAIKDFESVGPHTVQVMEGFANNLAAGLQSLAASGFKTSESVAFLASIRQNASQAIADHVGTLPADDRKKARINDQDVVIGGFQAAVTQLDETEAKQLATFLQSDEMKAISEFSNNVGRRAFEELNALKPDKRVPDEGPMFREASAIASMHSTLESAVQYRFTGVAKESKPEALSAKDFVSKTNEDAKPKLTEQDPGLVRMMSKILDAPFLEAINAGG